LAIRAKQDSEAVVATTYIDKAKELRDQAWREVQTSPSFLAFKALDDAVAAMGGDRLIARPVPRENGPRPSVNTFARVKREHAPKRLSQADAGEVVLRERGEPLPVGRLMEAAIAKGAAASGKNPLANYRSALSKDDRFYSLTRNNMYFWWLKDVPLPNNWKEAPDHDLLTQSGASVVGNSNQKGGDGHAATMPS
jgi:hypothetical protein